MASPAEISPFTLAAVDAMRQLYPEGLADKSFDNTGLLLESPINKFRKNKLKNSVLLTIDVTTAVTDEAIEKEVSLIISYHPIIFRGLKSITTADSQQRSLLRLASEGISVYSPHTAVDAAEGGNADWIAHIVTSESQPVTSARSSSGQESALGSQLHINESVKYVMSNFPGSSQDNSVNVTTFPEIHQRRSIVPSLNPPQGHHSAGMGRVVFFKEKTSLDSILARLLGHFQYPRALKLALPHPRNVYGTGSVNVSSIAICAGSGGSVFSKMNEHLDLLITGEMSHHEVLAATERGQTVICLDHSNSERGYLQEVMQGKLSEAVASSWEEKRRTVAIQAASREAAEICSGGVDSIHVSQADRDPFSFLVRSA